MGLDNRAADREPDADPVGFRRIKAIENAIEFRRIQPGEHLERPDQLRGLEPENTLF